MPHYFFSDAHLGIGTRGDDRGRERRVLAFLEAIIPDAESLTIVGDLFDYWFEYREVIPKFHVRTLAALARFAENGCRVDYLMGNHDFGHRDYFHDELGIDVHDGDLERTIDGRRLYIAHGDGKAFNDTGYLILRRVLRNRINQALFRVLHPDWGIGLAKSTSKTSRAYTDQKDYGEADGLRIFAALKIDEGFDYVIMGHRHFPAWVPIGTGVYVNLGAWLDGSTYAVMRGGVLDLRDHATGRSLVPQEPPKA